MKRRAVAVVILTVGHLAAFAGVALADTGPDGRTFSDIVAQARVVLLGQVTVGPDEGLRIRVEQVLKGDAPANLAFAPPTMAPELTAGGRAIIAFTDLSTIDFRAPTTAWLIGPAGEIDPGGVQTYPGLPSTLDGVLAYFGAPSAQQPPGAERTPGLPWAAILVVAGIGFLFAAGLVSRSSR